MIECITVNVTRTRIPVHATLYYFQQELESLGISVKHLGDLNDDKELDILIDNIKQEFIKEVREMEKRGLFVNPGAG